MSLSPCSLHPFGSTEGNAIGKGVVREAGRRDVVHGWQEVKEGGMGRTRLGFGC